MPDNAPEESKLRRVSFGIPEELAAALESQSKGRSLEDYLASIAHRAAEKAIKPSAEKASAPPSEKKITTSASTPGFADLGASVGHMNQAVNKEADYPCILVCASFLEKALGALLLTHFIDCTTAEAMLDPCGQRPLATFRARTDLAYCLGLISKGAFNNLNLVREVRNLCAHSHELIGFDHPDIAAVCNRLTLHKIMPNPSIIMDYDEANRVAALMASKPRDRFINVCSFLYLGICAFGGVVTKQQRHVDFWDQINDSKPSS
jgi:DNA-binding MltR family transcriptional regulator